jgi:LytS/YehU family sensor histidine kinase
MLITKLSGTLQYMINDCGAALVPLEKELKMIGGYTGLEEVRYGNRLKMKIEITGDKKNRMIASLLLIPLIENGFKHGTSQMLSVINGKPKDQKALSE